MSDLVVFVSIDTTGYEKISPILRDKPPIWKMRQRRTWRSQEPVRQEIYRALKGGEDAE